MAHSDRYHLVSLPDGMLGMTRGIPDPDKPNDSKKDRKDGPVLIRGDGKGAAFWTALQEAGYRWVSIGFHNVWKARY